MEMEVVGGQSHRPKLKKSPITYKALISLAILSSPEQRLTLSQIYQVIEGEFPNFTSLRSGWKNTVRHNLSIHECFVKGELASHGKSCYWRVHASFVDDFKHGDFSCPPIRKPDRVKMQCHKPLSPRKHSENTHERFAKTLSSLNAVTFHSNGVENDEACYYPTWIDEERGESLETHPSSCCACYCWNIEQRCVVLPSDAGQEYHKMIVGALPGRYGAHNKEDLF